MDLTRPSSGHDQAEDPLKIHHLEEEEHHESRASKMFGKVKAKAKRLKNRLTKHGDEHDNDVVDEEEDESDEAEPEKHVSPVNEVPNVRGYTGTSQPESLTHPGGTNVTEEIIPSGTKGSTDYPRTSQPEPLRDATYEEAPSYPVRTSDVSDMEESRETHHTPLKTPVSLLSETEDVTTPGEDGLLGGQREVNTDKPKRFEDELSGESTYQSKIPYHIRTQESGEDNQKSELGAELESESGNGKDSPVRFGGESETELGKDLPTRSFESEIGNDSPTIFAGKQETEGSEDFPAKSHEFEQTIGSGNGSGTQGTERREDFLGKSYEFDQEIESAFGEDSPTRLGGDEDFPTRSDDMKVEIGLGKDLPTETDGHFSPEFSGPKERVDFDSQAEQTRYEAQEVKPTTYSEMIGSSTDEVIDTKNDAAGQHESPMSVETVADKLTSDNENVKETASPFSGGGSEADETEQGRDKFVPAREHLNEKLTPEEEEDRAFSDMVAEKLNLGGEKKTTVIKEEVAVEKIPCDKLPEEIEGGEAVHEEGKGGGGIVGTIKGVYNYWLGGTEEVKPKSPNSVEESSQPLSSTVGTKGFSDSGESGLGETGGSTGTVPVQKGI